MGFFDDVQDTIGKGVSAARGAVSGVALESHRFVRGFVRMCDDGWRQGWHERNGGNASYRLTFEEASSARPFFNEEPGAWIALGVAAPELAGAYFLVTAAGSFMRNVADDTAHTVGIVELDAAGGAYRVVWGFKGDGVPTSEFAGHVLIHAARARATDGAARVVYHAHPTSVIALSKVLPPKPRAFSRELWRAMTECVMVFPEGVGAVGCKVPGSLELARASAEQMGRFSAVVWAHHGLLCSGTGFDDAFGRLHAIVKAADICVATRQMTHDAPAFNLADDDLRAIARELGCTLNEELLGDEAADAPAAADGAVSDAPAAATGDADAAGGDVAPDASSDAEDCPK